MHVGGSSLIPAPHNLPRTAWEQPEHRTRRPLNMAGCGPPSLTQNTQNFFPSPALLLCCCDYIVLTGCHAWLWCMLGSFIWFQGWGGHKLTGDHTQLGPSAQAQSFFVLAFGFGPHPALLRAYSWLFCIGIILGWDARHLTEAGQLQGKCLTHVLTPVLSLWPPLHNCKMKVRKVTYFTNEETELSILDVKDIRIS